MIMKNLENDTVYSRMKFAKYRVRQKKLYNTNGYPMLKLLLRQFI